MDDQCYPSVELLAQPAGIPVTADKLDRVIGPGSSIYIKRKTSHESSKAANADEEPENFDEGFEDGFEDDCNKREDCRRDITYFSLGCVVIDRKSCNKYILTTFHSLGYGSRNSDEYSFYSKLKKNNEVHELPLAEKYKGYFGPDSCKRLVDAMVLPVTDNFLAEEHVIMTFSDPKDPNVTVWLNVYTGSMEDLVGSTVYKVGASSGLTIGVVKDHDWRLNIKGAMGNVFTVLSDPQSKSKAFATSGDSGSLVYGKHPKSGDSIALGLVVGRNKDKIFCSPISAICQYMQENLGLDIEIYNPAKPSQVEKSSKLSAQQKHPPTGVTTKHSFASVTKARQLPLSRSVLELGTLGHENITVVETPKREYGRKELEKLFDDLINNINKQNTKLPAFVYSMQLPDKQDNIFICVDKKQQKNAQLFSYLRFGDCANIVLRFINPPRELAQCSFCNNEYCPSKTGQFRQTTCRDSICPGAPIVAMDTNEWESFSSKYGANKTLEDVRKFCMTSTPHLGAKDKQQGGQYRCFFKRWTLGGHFISHKNDKHKLFTVAHPLKTKPEGVRIVFLTELEVGGNPKLLVLGHRYHDLYDEEKAIDITIIDPAKHLDLNLLQMKVKENCGPEYSLVNPRIHHGRSEQIVGANVTKCGINTGHTYGQVISGRRLYVLTEQGRRAVNAFGVNSTETRANLTLFASDGDSGALVHETMPLPQDPYAYGLVWKEQEDIENELKTEAATFETAIVCVSLSNNLEFQKPRLNDIYSFRTPDALENSEPVPLNES